MKMDNAKLELVNLITVIFQNTGFDADVIEELDFVDDLGMDSVTFISIVIEIESYFDIQVPDDYLLINKFRSVARIMSIIEEELLKKKIGVD